MRHKYQPVQHDRPESALLQIPEEELWYVCRYEAGIHTIPSDADNSLQHEGLLDLGWMMCVIINDGNTADLTFILETTVCTGKASETFDDHIIRKVQKASYGNGGQCIGYVVDTRYTQIIAADLFATEENGEGRMSVFIPGNVCCGVIGIVLQTIGKNIAWKLPGDRLILRCVGVDDQSAVSREKLCKFPEGWRMSSMSLKKSR